jgi:hypothetical protein
MMGDLLGSLAQGSKKRTILCHLGWIVTIGLDGCFLKRPFKGTLLATVSRDANNDMYPVTIAMVEAEIKDSLSWLLETLV